MKASFTVEWLALPPKEVPHILDKINLLTEDPTPDAKTKKQLKHLNPRLYRMRCGDYRIFYTFETPYISLLSIRRRKEGTYDEDLDAEFLGGIDPEIHLEQRKNGSEKWGEQFQIPEQLASQELPEPITPELLSSLKIPPKYHIQLKDITTEEALLDCSNVPSKFLDRLVDALYPSPLPQLMQQPDFLVPNGSDDLLRIKEGELTPFLLQLFPEQEKYVTGVMSTSSSTSLKNGSSTSQNTIALYRVRTLLGELLKNCRKNYYTCFISYSTQDQNFAEYLYTNLQNNGVDCWFAPEDLKIGDHYHERIDESIRLYDKLILILSEHAIQSAWVEREVVAAREKEDRERRSVLFPIRLDEAVMNTTKAWAADVRRRWHIGDFTRWQDLGAHQQAFERLLRDLKAE